jgi:hypothetical protein
MCIVASGKEPWRSEPYSSERNIARYETILSGDLKDNDFQDDFDQINAIYIAKQEVNYTRIDGSLKLSQLEPCPSRVLLSLDKITLSCTFFS